MGIESKPPSVPLVDLAAQYAAISEEIDEAISRVVRGTAYILGRELSLFEEEFAAYCEVRCAVGVDSGTSALELALRAHGIGPGDEVITVANTFIATALAISHCGATPVLVDADPETYTIDVSQLEMMITDRTRAIIPVHLYGHPADMDPIMTVARRRGLVVIEDACQAHGARYKGRRVGSLGHAAAFSFYPAKNLGAYGDGGIVVTNDEGVADRVRLLRDYGQRQKYRHELRGYNRRLDTLQAAVLRVKLRYLDAWNAARRKHAHLYHQLLGSGGATLPAHAAYAEPVWHLYVVQVADRDALARHLAAHGIGTGVHYPVPIHLQPAYGDLGHQRGDFPFSEHAAGRILSLPMYAELTPALIAQVAWSVGQFLAQHAGRRPVAPSIA